MKKWWAFVSFFLFFPIPAQAVIYDLASGVVSFIATHPFYVVTGTNREFSGQLELADPKVSARLKMSVRLKAKGFRTADAETTSEVQSMLGVDRFPDIIFETAAGERREIVPGQIRIAAYGHLQVRDAEVEMFFPIDCHTDEDSARCHWARDLLLSDMGFAPPKVFHIPMRDRMAVSGELHFVKRGR